MSKLKVSSMVLGLVQTNCYIISNRQTKDCVFVDPADSAHKLTKQITQMGYHPMAILLTHGHFDHIMAVNELKKQYDIPIYAAKDEEAVLTDATFNLSGQFGPGYRVNADYLLQGGEELELLDTKVQTILTPGHTSGSMCYYFPEDGFLMSGDMLFCESVGRTDLPTGSSKAILDSLKNKVLVLPDQTIVYPGHGESTDIAHEKAYNPYA